MKLRNNKKGFTIVELVIVIAVIAILAAVLIPNLSRLVEKANESKAMQEAKNAYEAYLITEDSKTKKTPAENMDSINLCIKSGEHYYHVTNGSFSATEVTVAEDGTHSHADGVNFVSMKVEKGELVPVTSGSTTGGSESGSESGSGN